MDFRLKKVVGDVYFTERIINSRGWIKYLFLTNLFANCVLEKLEICRYRCHHRCVTPITILHHETNNVQRK